MKAVEAGRIDELEREIAEVTEALADVVSSREEASLLEKRATLVAHRDALRAAEAVRAERAAAAVVAEAEAAVERARSDFEAAQQRRRQCGVVVRAAQEKLRRLWNTGAPIDAQVSAETALVRARGNALLARRELMDAKAALRAAERALRDVRGEARKRAKENAPPPGRVVHSLWWGAAKRD